MVDIKSIFCSDGNLYFDTSSYFTNNEEELVKVFVRFSLPCDQEIDSCKSLLEYLKNSDENLVSDYSSKEQSDVERYRKCIDKVKDNTDFLAGIKSYELYGIRSESQRDTEFDMPVWFSTYIKCEFEDGTKKVIRTSFSLSDGNYDKTNEGVSQYYDEGKYTFYSVKIYDELGFDWEELNEEYKLNDFQVGKQQSEQNQEAEAQATSNKFTNADGTKNYAGYVEDKGATEVKTTQQNPQVVEMNLGL